MKHCYSNVARLIKEKRAIKRLSQSQACISIGFHPQFLSNVERGKCSIPLKKFNDFCKSLDIPVIELKRAIIRDKLTTIDNYILTENINDRI